MKYAIYILAFAIGSVFITDTAFAQGGVSINAADTAADPSAILDVASTSKGILVPRMTAANRSAISSPATGLEVYQTDGTAGFYYYNGSTWQQVGYSVQPHMQLFSTPGNYFFTTSSNITTSTMFKITMIGGGGTGGTAQSSIYCGGGGGAGGSIVYWTFGLSPNTSYYLQVATGGVPANPYGGQSFLNLPNGLILQCFGGSASSGFIGEGAIGGGTLVSGSITGSILANNGGAGSTVVGNSGVGGNGGSSIYGSGGVGGSDGQGGANSSTNGGTGGGGGGGEYGFNANVGGNGGSGLVLVEWSE